MKSKYRLGLGLGTLLVVGLSACAGGTGQAQSLLNTIKTVGKEGQGNVEAAKAWKELTQLGPGVLIDTLSALDDANPVAANYLRAAVEAIADKALGDGKKLPA